MTSTTVHLKRQSANSSKISTFEVSLKSEASWFQIIHAEITGFFLYKILRPIHIHQHSLCSCDECHAQICEVIWYECQ